MTYFGFIISEDSVHARRSGRVEKLTPWQSVWNQGKTDTEKEWSRSKTRTQL